MVGIEPTTDGLRNRCSTAELHWLPVWPETYRQELWRRKEKYPMEPSLIRSIHAVEEPLNTRNDTKRQGFPNRPDGQYALMNQ